MPHRFVHLNRCAAILLASIAVSACGSAPPSPSPPSWTNAPSQITVKEGTSTTLQITLQGVSGPSPAIEVATGNGLSARVQNGPSVSLAIEAAFDAPESSWVRLRIPSGTSSVEHTVPVRVQRLSWIAQKSWSSTDAPSAREHANFFYDDSKHIVYMLHGSGYGSNSNPLPDAWTYNLQTQTWAPWSPTGDVPPPAAGAAPRASLELKRS